ncbi:MAG: protein kinase [Myxococcota bacterium]
MTSSVAKPKTEVADLRGVVLDGRYEIGAPLSAGGMGTVYTGTQLALRRSVAIKLVKPGVMNRDVQVRRLVREAQTTAMVKHPNVIEIIDTGVMQHGFVYLVMELLEGHDLRTLLRKERRLEWTRARNIAMQVVSALKAAHAQGVIHRDIKPSNVFLVEQAAGVAGDFVKVLDFGLAKCRAEGRTATLTGADEVVGTAAYLAPEVARGKKADFRSEVYAVGVLMYKMATGTVPFKGSNPLDVLAKAIANPVPPPRSHNPDLPEEADRIIRRCLSKRPELRPQTMEELERDLYRIGGGELVSGYEDVAPVTPAAPPTPRFEGTQVTPVPVMPPPAPRTSPPPPPVAKQDDEDPSDVLEQAISEVLELDADEMVEVESGASGFLIAAKAEEEREAEPRPALRIVPDPEPTPLPSAPPVPHETTQPAAHRPAKPGTQVSSHPGRPAAPAPYERGFASALPRDNRGFAPALSNEAPDLSPILSQEPPAAAEPAREPSRRWLFGLLAAVPVVIAAVVGALFILGVVPMPGASTSAKAYAGVLGERLPDPEPAVILVGTPAWSPDFRAVPAPSAVVGVLRPEDPAIPTLLRRPRGAKKKAAPAEPAKVASTGSTKPAKKKASRPKAKPKRRRRQAAPAAPKSTPRPAPPPPPSAPKPKKKKKKKKTSSDSSAPWKRVPVPSDNW